MLVLHCQVKYGEDAFGYIFFKLLYLLEKGNRPSLSTCDPLSQETEHWTTFSMPSGQLATLMIPKTSLRPFHQSPAQQKRGLGQ